jgi:hypothetical protein
VSFDEEFARLKGVPVAFFYLLLLCLVAVTVVLLIQVVGLILVIALLTLPAAVAGHYVHSLGAMMALATVLGAAFASAGLALSYGPDLPAGPTIILLAGPGDWHARFAEPPCLPLAGPSGGRRPRSRRVGSMTRSQGDQGGVHRTLFGAAVAESPWVSSNPKSELGSCRKLPWT